MCKTVIFPVILCGCGPWYRTLKEEHRLQVWENKVLKNICGLKTAKVTGGWRLVGGDEIKEDEVGKICRMHGEDGNTYKF